MRQLGDGIDVVEPHPERIVFRCDLIVGNVSHSVAMLFFYVFLRKSCSVPTHNISKVIYIYIYIYSVASQCLLAGSCCASEGTIQASSLQRSASCAFLAVSPQTLVASVAPAQDKRVVHELSTPGT